jgi:hypothetical protein
MDDYQERCNATLAYRLMLELQDRGILDDYSISELRWPSTNKLIEAEAKMK